MKNKKIVSILIASTIFATIALPSALNVVATPPLTNAPEEITCNNGAKFTLDYYDSNIVIDLSKTAFPLIEDDSIVFNNKILYDDQDNSGRYGIIYNETDKNYYYLEHKKEDGVNKVIVSENIVGINPLPEKIVEYKISYNSGIDNGNIITDDYKIVPVYSYSSKEERDMIDLWNYVYNPTKGDINFDKNVNSLDALLILKYCANLFEIDELGYNAADINYDGKVNTLDSLTILKEMVE